MTQSAKGLSIALYNPKFAPHLRWYNPIGAFFGSIDSEAVAWAQSRNVFRLAGIRRNHVQRINYRYIRVESIQIRQYTYIAVKTNQQPVLHTTHAAVQGFIDEFTQHLNKHTHALILFPMSPCSYNRLHNRLLSGLVLIVRGSHAGQPTSWEFMNCEQTTSAIAGINPVYCHKWLWVKLAAAASLTREWDNR